MDDQAWDRYLDELDRMLDLTSQFFSGRLKEKYFSGFSHTHIAILRKISREPGITATQLAERFGISAAAISKLVDQLVLGGLLLRQRSDTDRRVVILQLTPDGEHLLQENTLFRRTIIKEVLSTLPETDLESLFGIIQKIHDRVDQLRL